MLLRCPRCFVITGAKADRTRCGGCDVSLRAPGPHRVGPAEPVTHRAAAPAPRPAAAPGIRAARSRARPAAAARRIVITDDAPRLIGWAVRLRRLWFDELESALEAALPGASEALASATCSVREDGTMVLHLPSIYPVLPPVYDVVQDGVAALLWDVFGNPVAHTTKIGGATPRRPKPSSLSVYTPGDPGPIQWPGLSASLREQVLTADEPAIGALFDGVRILAVSLDSVWLEFATPSARLALGKLPGAASGLNERLSTWNGGVTAFCTAAP